jgi:hypothetical protein
MTLTCSHCSRPNPSEAVFCWHDGQPLANGHAAQRAPALQRFPAALVMPSGRQCWTYDQLAQACQEEWAPAADLLQRGLLEQFMAKLGRMDLALAARSAAGFPDRDRGLDQFLARLPSQLLQPPKLQTSTTEINLGTIRADTDQQISLRLANGGMRLLYGSISSDSPWLLLGDSPGASQKLFQCASETTVTVRIAVKRLRAGHQGMEGRLVIDSNGGTATVVVRAEVLAKAFPQGVLAGSTTPRQLAEKARANPKDAVPLFENGSVARWYADNGWPFPVQGPAASGLAAVQQFFEALGLAKPPRIELPESAVQLRGQPGETMTYPLRVSTPDKRPIFAWGVADQPWLSVGKAALNGSQGTLPLQINAVPPRQGQVLQANVTVTANGGQKFIVPVALAVGDAIPIAAPAAMTIAPIDTDIVAVAVPTPAPPRQTLPAGSPGKRSPALQFLHLLPLVPLFFILFAVLGYDLAFSPERTPVRFIAEVQSDTSDQGAGKGRTPDTVKSPGKGPPTYKVAFKDEKPEFNEAVTTPLPVQFKVIDEKEERPEVKTLPVKVEIKDDGDGVVPGQPAGKAEVDTNPRIRWQYSPDMRFGFTAVDTGKLLTYSATGVTNETCLRVNGQEGAYGGRAGKFTEKDTKLPVDTKQKTYGGSKSVWVSGNIVYTQILELVPNNQPVMVNGKPKLLLDTVRVRYIIENRDRQPMKIGLRIQVDTLIGNNDGVPFTVPGQQGLVTQFADFPKMGPIPDFIQALERPNLQDPGTVAHMSLKLGGKIEAPGRVSLTHWPGGTSPFEVQLSPLNGDSAVILYWPEQALKPGEKREMGFAYGLGTVASEAGNKIGITLGGSFEPGEAFTVTAYVQNPVNGQTLTLEVPNGLERLEGQQVEKVPPPAQGSNNTSIVTWKVKVLQTGTFPLKVVSSTGQSQTKTISIARPEAEGERRLKVDLTGSFEPGQEFSVKARLEAMGQPTIPEAKLSLPAGLVQTGGPTYGNPQAVGGNVIKEASWTVKVTEPGKYPIRVEWFGAANTKTIVIARPETPTGGAVTMALEPPFAPGQAFTVSATVKDPVAGQTLILTLPANLRLIEGKDVVTLPRSSETSTVVKWKVMVEKAGTFPLRLQSGTGVTLKKTITIEPRDDGGGTFVLKHSGEVAPGSVFKLQAVVTNPVPDQKLTLKLPSGLELIDAPAVQTVPPGAGKKDNVSAVSWSIRVKDQEGTLPVRVVSTTGMARTLTIVLSVEQPSDNPTLFTGGKR